MIQTSQPSVKLNGIEYLLISIQSNPGKSQRWHLRRKYMYQHGVEDCHKGGSGAGYFRSESYRNVLWIDRSTTKTRYDCSRSVNSVFLDTSCGSRYPHSYAHRSSCSQMHLTSAGWRRANEARKKLGVSSITAQIF